MSGSRECKVCNTVNSSGPALQARGLLVNQFLNRSNSCQIKAGNREFRNQSRILCWKAGFSSFGKIWQTALTASLSSLAGQGLSREHAKTSDGRLHTLCHYIMCSLRDANAKKSAGGEGLLWEPVLPRWRGGKGKERAGLLCACDKSAGMPGLFSHLLGSHVWKC